VSSIDNNIYFSRNGHVIMTAGCSDCVCVASRLIIPLYKCFFIVDCKEDEMDIAMRGLLLGLCGKCQISFDTPLYLMHTMFDFDSSFLKKKPHPRLICCLFQVSKGYDNLKPHQRPFIFYICVTVFIWRRAFNGTGLKICHIGRSLKPTAIFLVRFILESEAILVGVCCLTVLFILIDWVHVVTYHYKRKIVITVRFLKCLTYCLHLSVCV